MADAVDGPQGGTGITGGAPAPVAPGPCRDRVRLFEADPDLLRRTPPDLRDTLTRHVTVPVNALAPGSWEPVFPKEQRIVAFFVLDGVLSRETRLLGERGVELLGPGDPMRPPEGCDWTTTA